MINLTISSGPFYLLQGLRELFKPGRRRYIIIPVLINALILSLVISTIGWYLWELFASLSLPIPEWLQLLIGGLLLVIYLLGSIFVSTTCFSLLCNLLASPFHGFLSEKVINDQLGIVETSPPLLKLMTRTVQRETRKLIYGLPRFGFGLILFLFPLTTPIFPLYWFYIMSWYLSMTYIDYAADNQQVPFRDLLMIIRKNRLTVISFGITVSIGFLIPFVNLFIPPAAVIGGTLLWLDLTRNAS